MTSVSQSQNLVILQENVPLTDSRIVAEKLGIDHQNFFAMIKTYQKEVEEEFDFIRFKQIKSQGRPQKYALLTEDQAYTYLTFSQNTEQARQCKILLVKAFSEAKKQLAAQHTKKRAPKPVEPKPEVQRIGPPPQWVNHSPGFVQAYFQEMDETSAIEEATLMLFDYLQHMNEPMSIQQIREQSPILATIPLKIVRQALEDSADFGQLDIVKQGKARCYVIPDNLQPATKAIVIR